jgi:hypothetical protein
MKTMIFALAMAAASLGATAIPAFARGEGTPFIDPNGFPPGFFDGVPYAGRIVAQQNAMAAAERPQGQMFQVPNTMRTPGGTPPRPITAQG